jgi:hypothetical protein
LGACNQQIVGESGFVGVGAQLPLVAFGAEVHGQATYTGQAVFFQFNLYNAVENAGFALGNWLNKVMGGL